LTYGELNEAANRLAHRLRALGAGRDQAVALCVDRSPGAIVGLLGIQKAGAAYVPLNFEHPPSRLAHQLQEAEAVGPRHAGEPARAATGLLRPCGLPRPGRA
jgi:non-ribosomal peptide synthetase component F